MSTFHRFLLLPAEIKLMIWEAFTQLPRIVELEYTENPRSQDSGRFGPDHHAGHHKCFSPTPFPAIFHVCQDSRAVARRSYSKAFCCSHSSSPEHFVWLNYNIDIIKMTITWAPTIWDDEPLVQRLHLVCDDELVPDEFRTDERDYFFFDSRENFDAINRGSIDAWLVCGEAIRSHIFENITGDVIRVTNIESGEAIDITRGGRDERVVVQHRMPRR